MTQIYADKIKKKTVLNNKFEKGIVGALNTGLQASEGEYIARFDADDICGWSTNDVLAEF